MLHDLHKVIYHEISNNTDVTEYTAVLYIRFRSDDQIKHILSQNTYSIEAAVAFVLLYLLMLKIWIA